MKKALISLLALIALLICLLYITDNQHLLKGLRATYLNGETTATIDDAKYFDTNQIKANPGGKWPYEQNAHWELSERLNQTLEELRSVAFIVIQNDTVRYENYWDGYSAESHSNSFSMAKSITTMLAQIAIQEGVFSGWNQKVIEILPNLSGEYASEVELWHLATMSSGQMWEEHYKNPFGITAKAYYGSDVWKLIESLPIIEQPGVNFNYQSGSTQLLGIALIQASGKSLAELASKWMWQPMQAEQDAMWHTDPKGIELAYCCFNSNARDFARFGRLTLNHGDWFGEQILDSAWVALATESAYTERYGCSFWIDESQGTKVHMQRGVLGQYIMVIPEYNAVIVRLGHERMEPQRSLHPEETHIFVEELLPLLEQGRIKKQVLPDTGAILEDSLTIE